MDMICGSDRHVVQADIMSNCTDIQIVQEQQCTCERHYGMRLRQETQVRDFGQDIQGRRLRRSDLGQQTQGRWIRAGDSGQKTQNRKLRAEDSGQLTHLWDA